MENILNTIKSPDMVKNLSLEEKEQLCKELREVIMDTVSNNGGHLASNLGTVELTVALFSVLDLDKDKIVWDVGHQCYSHKLLTGRYEEFHTLRTNGGLSGFPDIDESKYDPFTTGHSSASISSAFGLSQGEYINHTDGTVVAIIGDGALTGGLSFEGLNNAGRTNKNFIVILNDNNMSISSNVGSLNNYLNNLRGSLKYIRNKRKLENLLLKIPKIGRKTLSFLKKVKRFFKTNFYNSTIFEDMGFIYYGPYDGHDISDICEILESVKAIDRPVLIHLNTVKGKGYEYAEENPNEYHGVPKFDIKSGGFVSEKSSFTAYFSKKITSLARQNYKVCAITAAMSNGTGLKEFQAEHSNRFFDVGIAEGHAVTFAAGLSKSGLIPVFAVYSTFLQRAYDNIIHDIALQNLKCIFAIDRAGLVGTDGKTHQGVFDVGYLKTIPNITVFSPSYYAEMDVAFNKAVKGDYKLTAIRYPKGSEPEVPDGFTVTGDDYDVYGNKTAKNAVICYGRIFDNAVKALGNFGDNAKIVKLNKILPISEEAVKEVVDCENILFLEEAVSGINENFAVKLLKNGYKGSYNVRDIKNGFIPHALVDEQLKMLGLDVDGILSDMEKYFK